MKKKIHIENLTENALKWWYEQRLYWQNITDITRLYMKENKIKNKDVNW
jgi:hypothetical protein